MKNGKAVITESKNSFANSDISSHTPPFRMSPADRNSSSRASLFSGGQPPMPRQQAADSGGDGFRSSDGFKSELKGPRRLLHKSGSGMDYSGNQQNQIVRKATTNEPTSYTEKKIPPSLIRRSQNSGVSKFTLPEVAPKGNNVLPPISGTSLGMMGSYEPSALTQSRPSVRKVGQSQRDNPLVDSVNRPPLYKKAGETVREGNNFSDDPLAPVGRYRVTSQTQYDFNNVKKDMNSSTGMASNVNTIMTGTTIPQATFEISTTNYGAGKKPKKRDILDEEINKFNYR